METLPPPLLWPALVSLGCAALLTAIGAYVGRMRGRYRIAAPSISGAPEFERAFRVHANTLENTVALLPPLWVCALTLSPTGAGLIGAVWLAARVWYAISYIREPKRRGPAFLIAAFAWGVLFAGAIVGIFRPLLTT